MSNYPRSPKGQLQELRDEYEKLGKPGEEIAKALYEIAFNKWGKIKDKWMVNIEEGKKIGLEKEDGVWSFLSEYFLHLAVSDPETGERLNKKDQLAWVFKDGLAEPGKGIKDFNNLMFWHMDRFLDDRFKDTPAERHVKRVSKILSDSSFGFGNRPSLSGSHATVGEKWIGTGNEFYDLVVKVQRKHPPRKPPDNVENFSRWWMFWSGEELEELVWFVLDESRQMTSETDYLLTRDEWKQIFKEILTFTESTTFSFNEEFDLSHTSDEVFPQEDNQNRDRPSSIERERIKEFLGELDESEYKLIGLKMVCMDRDKGNELKLKTDIEIAGILGITRQTVSSRWKKIDSRIDDFLGKNSGQERRWLRGVLKEDGSLCENENCVCHLEVER